MLRQSRRALLASLAGLGSTSLLGRSAVAFQADAAPVFTPEQFGARGGGVGNDTAAFAAMARAVNARGGGTVVLRATTYIVGAQLPVVGAVSQYLFDPASILDITGCRGPVVIRGNGARLRCADGLRYGTFDTGTRRPRAVQLPYLGGGLATPYRQMIKIERCSGPVLIEDLELDGNAAGLVLGGHYGDTGWQIPATGITLADNRGDEILRDIHTHHHALDGLIIDGDDKALPRYPQRRIERVRAEYNGRQGCSIVGGRGYLFRDCSFSHTGRSALSSAPGAGVDIEAEGGKRNRDLRFVSCRFADNTGAGMVADSGDSEGATFERCTFVGTTSWSAWPSKPLFEFRTCSFAGALTRAYGSDDPRRAAQFLDCSFRDDPALSNSGRLYRGVNLDGPLADLSDAQNVRFARCTFLATHSGTLPWSTGAIYEDCRMEQRSLASGYPRGRFAGRTSITGKVDLYGSIVDGELILNGTRLGPGRHF